MEKELELNGKKFISAKRAAEISGYSSDYVGQLIRAQKISGTLVGRSWYVDKEEILNHKKLNYLKTTKKENKNKSTDSQNQENVPDQNKKKSKKLIELAEKNQYFVMGLNKDQSRKAEIDLDRMLYIKDESPLFVEPLKKFDVGRGHYEALEALKTSLSKKPSKSLVDKLALGVSTLSMLVLVFWSFANVGSIDFEKAKELGPTSVKQEIENVWNLYGESVVGQFGLDKNNFGGSVLLGDNLRFAGSAFLGWEKVSDWFVDTAIKIAMPWIRESWIAKIDEQKFIQSPNGKVTSSGGKGGQTVISKTVVVETSDRNYIDSKIAELKNYFLTSLTNPVAPIVTRYYITNQNDSIVDALSKPITSLSDVTIGGNSSFSGSASLSTLGVSGTTTVADLTASEWIAIGTSTSFEALTLDGALYLGTNTAPTNTTYRLYNTNNGDLYWNGSLLGGATVGNWTTDGTSVWRTGGNVGVGTTSPYAKLSVVGDGVFTRNLNTANFLATGTATFTNLSQGVAYIGSNNLLQTAASSSIFGFTPISNSLTKGYFLVGDDAGVAQATSSIFVSSTGKIGIASTTPYAKFAITNTSADPSFIVEDSASPDSSPFIIDATGNVGIGTTAPNEKLHLEGTSVGIRLKNTTTTTGKDWLINSHATQGTLDFYSTSGSVNAVSIKTDGNVGIGTTGPGAKLDIRPTNVEATLLRLQGNEEDDVYHLQVNSTADGSGNVKYVFSTKDYGNSNYDVLTVQGKDGNVGIGTTGPAKPLDIVRANDANIRLAHDGTYYAYIQHTGLDVYNNPMQFKIGGAEKVRIDTSGNVGIGTTSPSAVLHVVQNSSYSSDVGSALKVGNAATPTKRIGFGYDTTIDAGFIQTTQEGVGVKSLVLNPSGGNVGIGTTAPGQKLDVAGSAAAWNFYSPATAGTFGDSGGAKIIVYGSTGSAGITNAIRFDTAGSERMRITNDGNVGIGTTGPSTLLHIVGGANANNGLLELQPNASGDNAGLTLWSRASGAATGARNWQLSNNYSVAGLFEILYSSSNSTNPTASALAINSSGNVGIGTTGPGAKLDIYGASTGHTMVGVLSDVPTYGAIGFQPTLVASNYTLAGLPGGQTLINGQGGSTLNFRIANADKMVLDSNGNVGIGTTGPGYKLEVQQTGNTNDTEYLNAYFSNNVGGGVLIGYVGDGTDAKEARVRAGGSIPLALGTTGSKQAVYILNDGNVGIGTNAPGGKLQISTSTSNFVFGGPVGSVTGQNYLQFEYDESGNFGSIYTHTWGTGNRSLVLNRYGGNVGIGTTGPGTKLEVYGSGTVESRITSTNGAAQLTLWGNTLGQIYNVAGALGITQAANSYVYFAVNGSERVRIINDGNVGIGTTNPQANLQLGAGSGEIGVRISGGAGLAQILTRSGSTGNVLEWQTDPTGAAANQTTLAVDNSNNMLLGVGSAVTILSTGNVGIGTTGPNVKLEVSDTTGGGIRSSYTGTTGGIVQLFGNSDGSSVIRGTAYTGTAALTFQRSSGAETMRIDNTGNVGIGTTGPNVALQVVGYIQAGSSAYADQGFGIGINGAGDRALYWSRATDSGNQSWVFGDGAGDAAAGTFGIANFSVTSAPALVISTSGNIGIGTTSPATLFDVNGLSTFRSYSTWTNGGTNAGFVGGELLVRGVGSNANLSVASAGSGNLNLNTSAGEITFTRAANEWMRINSTGNVGIGTTGPAVKLDVVSADNAQIGIKRNANSNEGNLWFRTGATSDWVLGLRNTSDSDFHLYNFGTSADALTVLRANGNVGIGTTSPGYKLDVQSTGHAITNAETSATGDYVGGYRFASPVKAWGMFTGAAGHALNGKLGIYDYGSSAYRLVIDTNGNVGIGTTDPGQKLQVAGNVLLSNASAFMQSNAAGSAVIQVGSVTGVDGVDYGYNSGAAGLQFYNGTGVSAIIKNGNVGIGTTGPGSTLHVVGGEIRLQNDNSFYSAYSTAGGRLGYMQWNKSNGNLIINNENTGGISLYSNGSERVTIKSDGNVGIGTTGPLHKLEVIGAANTLTYTAVNAADVFSLVADGGSNIDFRSGNSVSSGILWSDPEARAMGNLRYQHSTNKMEFYTNGASTANVVIDSSGNVGIGTTNPNALLHLRVSTANPTKFYMQNDNSDTGKRIFATEYDQNVVNFRFKNESTDAVVTNAVTIQQSGNVGIGTTSPQSLLSIDGSTSNTVIGQLVQDNSFSGLSFGANAATVNTTNYSIMGNGTDTYINRPTGGLISFREGNSTTNMTIATGGNVGIGTTGPGAKFQVSADANITSLWNNAQVSIRGATNDSYRLNLGYDTTNNLGFIQAGENGVAYKNLGINPFGGNVGIGTTGPTNVLDVYGGATDSSVLRIHANSITTGGLYGYSATANSGYFSIGSEKVAGSWVARSTDASMFGSYMGEGFAFQVFTNTGLTSGNAFTPTERFTIKSDGNVGIGTTGPTTKLQVTGGKILLDNAQAYQLKASDGTAINALGMTSSNHLEVIAGAGGRVGLFPDGGNDGAGLSVIDGGNVGIGTTTPPQKLSVNGQGLFTTSTASPDPGDGAGPAVRVGYYTTGDYGYIYAGQTGVTNKSLILGTGNVGIGTTSPETALHVSGTGRVSMSGTAPYLVLGNANAGVNGSNYERVFQGFLSNIATIKSDAAGTGTVRPLAIYTGANTSQLYLSTAGNVGIGTTSPGYKLSVQNTSEGNTFQIYDTDGNCLLDPDSGGITTTCSSDARLKTNIEESNNVIEYLRNIPIKDFTVIASGDRRTGVIAQEMLVDYPELVHMGVDGYYGVSEVSSWKIIKGLQEQQTMIEDLQSGQADIVLVEQRLTALEVDTQATSTTLEGGGPSLMGRIMAYFKGFGLDIQNGFTRISKVFVGSLHIEGDVCVDDTCVTKDQFKEMILRSGVGAVQIVSSTPKVAGSSDSGSQTSTSTSAGASDSTVDNIDTATTTPEIVETTEENISEAPSSSQGEGVGDEVVASPDSTSAEGGDSTAGNVGTESQNTDTQVDTSQNLTP